MPSGITNQLKELAGTDIPAGFSRFVVQLSKLYNSLASASIKEDPASSLFDPAVRQHFFYLQALSRIYKKIHDREMFESLRKEFKIVEDQLGKIDFYDGWVKEFSQRQNFPSLLLDYYHSRKNFELDSLRKMLDEKKWIADDFFMVRKILSELSAAEWMSTENDRNAIAAFLDDELDDFEEDYHENKFDFNDVEEGIHEIRRQLRWFSIYAQALDGLIQIENVEIEDSNMKKYFTAEVLNSPYNILPSPKQRSIPLYIHAPEFYALSWMVNELGKLKDDGLRFHALKDAVEATDITSKKEADGYVSSFAGSDTFSPQEIPQIVAQLCDEFMNQHLVIKKIREDVKASAAQNNPA
jgi:hypothetical protein